MSIDKVRAFCRCDRCMAAMEVDIDPAEEVTSVLPSIFDVVEDAVRGGGGMGGQPTSVVKVGEGDEAYNEMLCGACTALEDAKAAAA